MLAPWTLLSGFSHLVPAGISVQYIFRPWCNPCTTVAILIKLWFQMRCHHQHVYIVLFAGKRILGIRSVRLHIHTTRPEQNSRHFFRGDFQGYLAEILAKCAQLTTCQLWIRQWLNAEQATLIYPKQLWLRQQWVIGSTKNIQIESIFASLF